MLEYNMRGQPKKKPGFVAGEDPPPEVTSNRDRRHLALGATDPRHIRSAEALRNALLTLLERKAFDQITVREICAEAGIHNATFFRHHADKEALLNHVAADEINRLVDFSLPLGTRIEGNQALCEYVSKHRTLWKALLNGGAGAAMRQEYLRLSQAIAETYSSDAKWLPHDLSVILSTMLIIETIAWWLDCDEDAFSPDQVAEIIDRLTSVPAAKKPPVRDRLISRGTQAA